MPTPALHLTEADVLPLLDMRDAIDCLARAFTRWGMADTVNLPRQRARPPQGILNLMGAVDGAEGVHGLKVYMPNPAGAAYTIALFSHREGRLLALIEAEAMSRVRTGAATGLATRLLANPEAERLGLIGTGGQAFAQAEAVAAVRPIREIRVFGRDPVKRDAFAGLLEKQLACEVRPVASAAAAVEGAGVVVAITKAAAPVIDAAWLAPGTHVVGAGANAPGKSEIDAATLLGAGVIATDDRTQAMCEAAELIELASQGRLDWSRVVELGDLVTGKAAGRTSAGEITVFKSLGIAFEDIAYAHHLYARAVAAGAGRRLA